jgi:hypothetical protein
MSLGSPTAMVLPFAAHVTSLKLVPLIAYGFSQQMFQVSGISNILEYPL